MDSGTRDNMMTDRFSVTQHSFLHYGREPKDLALSNSVPIAIKILDTHDGSHEHRKKERKVVKKKNS